MICKGEFILQEGEIGLEMYFIIEGKVDVFLSNGTQIATLTKGKPFGEMALLGSKPSVRGANVKARSDLALAVLSLLDF
jgi:CRP-like cAMP-binding protein